MAKRIVQVGGRTVATDGQDYFLVIRRSRASGGALEITDVRLYPVHGRDGALEFVSIPS